MQRARLTGGWRESGGWGAPAASLLLHGALVLALWAFHPARAPPPPDAIPIEIVADADSQRSGERDGPAAASAPSAPSPGVAAPAPPSKSTPDPKAEPVTTKPAATREEERRRAPQRRTRAPAGLEKPVSAVAALPQPGPVTPPAAEAAGPAAEDVAAGRSAPPSGAASAGTGGSTSEGHETTGTGADALAAYLTIVRRRIQERLVYPPAARRLGIAGRVDLRFTIQADGRVAADTLRIVGGSDSSLLRDGAADTIRLIAAFSPPPRGSIGIEVPVLFSLHSSQ